MMAPVPPKRKATVMATCFAMVTERWVIEIPEGQTLAEVREALQEGEISLDDLTVVSVENERVEDETQREVYEVRAYSVGD